MDTTASTTGADDERDDLEEEGAGSVVGEADLEAELALLNRSRPKSAHVSKESKKPSLTLITTAIAAASAMPVGQQHPNTPVTGTPPPTSTSASSASTTPLPHLINDEEAAEAQDEFRDDQQPKLQSSKSLPYHRPVPVLHHFSLTPPPKSSSGSGGQSKGAFTHHLHHLHHGGCRPLPSPQTPVQPQSLQLMPSQYQQQADAATESSKSSASGEAASNAMSRSISDSTLRRAALHLNLNQSVLPSFTSLQQFKVDIGISIYMLVPRYCRFEADSS